jgi:hypothetical protein
MLVGAGVIRKFDLRGQRPLGHGGAFLEVLEPFGYAVEGALDIGPGVLILLSDLLVVRDGQVVGALLQNALLLAEVDWLCLKPSVLPVLCDVVCPFL